MVKKLGRQLKNDKLLCHSWYGQVNDLEKKLSQVYGNQKEYQFQDMLKGKD